jgi:hypothetical protein
MPPGSPLGSPEDGKASREAARVAARVDRINSRSAESDADVEAKARARTYLVPSRMERGESMNSRASGSGAMSLMSNNDEEKAEEETTETKPAVYNKNHADNQQDDSYLAPVAPGAQSIGGFSKVERESLYQVAKAPEVVHDVFDPIATPVIAELAPGQDEVAELLRIGIAAQLSKEVADQLQAERQKTVIVDAVQVEKTEESTCCGMTRSKPCCIIFIVIFLLVVVGVVGAIVGIVMALGGDDDNGSSEERAVAAPTSAPITSNPSAFLRMTQRPTPSPTHLPTPRPTALPTGQPTPQPTYSPTPQPTISRLPILLNRIGTTLAPDGDMSLLTNPGTRQYEALQWLANSDPANLPLETTAIRILVERYTVALLYFSTGGTSWWDQHNFLSADTVCNWNDGNDWGDGIFCIGPLVHVIFLREC